MQFTIHQCKAGPAIAQPFPAVGRSLPIVQEPESPAPLIVSCQIAAVSSVFVVRDVWGRIVGDPGQEVGQAGVGERERILVVMYVKGHTGVMDTRIGVTIIGQSFLNIGISK